VKLGVETLRLFVKALKDRGADEVFVSTYHYFDGAAAGHHRTQYDPEYTGKVFAAAGRGAVNVIDCLPLSKQHHPLIVGEDRFHPSKAGHAVYSHRWFEALLKYDGREVPAWSRQEMQEALEREKAERERRK
jgi:hypothetical protein